MKMYGVIAENLDKFMKRADEAIRNYYSFDYSYIFKSNDPAKIVDYLKDKKAKDYTVEEFLVSSWNEYLEGSDYDTGSNFIKRYGG